MTLRTFAPYVIVALALLALAMLVVKLSPVLLLAFAGIVFAALIRSAAMPLVRRLHVPSNIAVSGVAIALGALLALGFWLFGRQLMSQTQELWSALQEAADKVRERFGDSPLFESLAEQVRGAASAENMNKVAKGTLTAFGIVVDMALVIFLSVYLALDPATYREGLVRLFPVPARRKVGAALDESGTALRRWLMGQLFAMACMGLLTGIGLHLVGVPHAVPLGILIGVLDFVPVVGPFIGAIPGVLIAFSQSPQLALYAIGVYVAMQFIEGHFIVPLAQRWAVSIPPAVTLLGIVAAGLLFGPMGVFLAMPLIVVAVTLVNKLYVEALE